MEAGDDPIVDDKRLLQWSLAYPPLSDDQDVKNIVKAEPVKEELEFNDEYQGGNHQQSLDANHEVASTVKNEDLFHNYTCHYCLQTVAEMIDLEAHLLIAHGKSKSDHEYEFGTDGHHKPEHEDSTIKVFENSTRKTANRTEDKGGPNEYLKGASVLKLRRCRVLINNSRHCQVVMEQLLKDQATMQQEQIVKIYPPSNFCPSGKIKMTLSYLEKYQVAKESVCNIVQDLCSYKCDKCGQIFLIHYRNFVVHLKKCKGKSSKFDWVHVYEIRYHDCFICGTRMFCDTDVVKHHITRQHSLHLPQYRKISTNKSQIQHTLPVQHTSKLSSMVNPESVWLPNKLFSHDLDDMCLFSCDKCNFTTSSWNIMSTHNAKSSHGTGSRKFDAKYVKDAMYHRCIICRRVVYCDNMCLFSHIYKMHKIKLADYKQMVKKAQSSNDLSHQLCEDQDKTEVKCNIKIVASEKYFKRYEIESDKVPQEYLTDEVGDYCEFVCIRCKYKALSWESMKKHIIGHNYAQVKNIKNFERRYLSEARLHRCRLCSMALYCDISLIRQHLIKGHHITSIAVYEKHYKPSNVNMLSNRRKPELKNNLASYDRSNGLVFTFTESLGHFYCSDCSYFANDYVVMRAHVMSTQHGLKEGEQVNRVTIKSAILHECQVCFQKISCSRSNLLYHVSNTHRLKGGQSEYYHRYILRPKHRSIIS